MRCQQNRSQPRIQLWPLETLSILVGVLQLGLFTLKPYIILWTETGERDKETTNQVF